MKICKECNTRKEYCEFEENRSICKECKNRKDRNRRYNLKKDNPVLYFCKQMASSAYSRVNAPSRKHLKGYRNLKNLFEFRNIPDMAKYLYDNFYVQIESILKNGESPSVDRIDSTIGYCKDNIQILTHKENTEDGLSRRRKCVSVTFLNGSEKYFKSTVDCVTYFGFSKASSSKVKSWVDRDGKYKLPPEVLCVEYL